jgi:release factor glutamine methyltransferase
MRIKEALRWGRQHLGEAPTATGDARLLLQHVLQVGRTYLVTHDRQHLNQEQEKAFRELVARARQGIPVPYLVGESPFFGLDFLVTPDVLIPRPETELLVENALDWAQAHQVHTAADIGTGSGCIAITLARNLPQVQMAAVDRSAAALTVARTNAERHGVTERITFYEGDLLGPLTFTPDLIIANLPYISDQEWTTVADGVKLYEPAGALRAGPDGLDAIRSLLQQAAALQPPAGALFLEIGWRQGETAQTLARSLFPEAEIGIRPDYAGHDRMLVIETR